MRQIRKYPRTRHVAGSRRQPGDEDLADAPFSEIAGKRLVIEEKLDGANSAFSFGPDGTLLLQSRGHYLTGGPRERHFDLFKRWAASIAAEAWAALGARYVVYGEWLYAKHTVFYDALPHYFLEFDVLDLEDEVFLSTEHRRALLAALPLASVPVLHDGALRSEAELERLIGPSRYKSPDWRARLMAAAEAPPHDPAQVERQTDPSDAMEGLYIKVESDAAVEARFKFVRPDFLTTVLVSESHWLSRPILPNALAPGVDLFGRL